MEQKPTYEELERRIKKLERESVESKKTREALKQAERKYRDIFENTFEGIYQTTPDGRIITANQAMAQMLGYDSSEDLLTSITDIGKPLYVDPDRRAEFQRLLGKHNIISNFECEYYCKDRSKIWVSENVHTVPSASGKILYYEGTFENITARKQAEEALRKSEQRLADIINFLPDATFAIDLEGKVIAWNRAIEEMTGIKAEDMLGKENNEYALPFYGTRRPILIDLALKSDKEIEEKYLFVRREGEALLAEPNALLVKGRKVFLWGKASPMYDYEGNVIGAIESIRDITARNQAEEALRKSEERYRALFDNNPVDTVIVDRQAKITEYNLARKRSDGRLPNINNDVMYKDYAAKHKTDMLGELMECIRSGESKKFLEQKYKDKFLDIKIAPFSEGAIITSINVTDRKRAEEELRESESRYRSVFENTGTATLIVEEDTILSMVNREFEQLFGYSKEEIEGKKSWTEFVAKEDLEKMKEYHRLRRIDPASAPRNYEFQFIDRYGDIKDIFITVAVIPGTNKSIASFSDITERKQAENKIRKSLKEKEVLLSEIHHRVKNNMQIVSSLLNLQSEYVKDKESLEMFKESRDRIFSMASVHEKLYQSKDLARIDFDDYIRSITKHLFRAYVVDPNAVRLNVNCSDVALNINKAVPCGLIINELISNALKHAFPEGRKGEITIDLHPDGDNRLTLAVSDNGVGFSEDIDISDSETLGLRLISILVTQLKGTLEIERDVGTTFKITFET